MAAPNSKLRQSEINNYIHAMVRNVVPQKLGSGTYGAIFSPALPNIVNGRVVEFPNNVIKIYFGKHAANKSKKSEALGPIINTMRLNNATKRRYTTYKYKKQYSKPELQSTYLELLSHKEKEKIQQNNTMYIARLPNLGKSFVDIVDPHQPANRANIIRSTNAIPFMKIANQMLECMHIVKAIHDHGYIHGDIRETNVMFDSNGNMTIIDFDWFLPFQEFLDRFPSFFYSHPPECLFVFGMSLDPNVKGDYAVPWKFTQHMGVHYLHKYYDYFKRTIKTQPYFFDSEEAAKGMEAFIDENKELFDTKQWSTLRKKLFDTVASSFIDSYGLGRAFFVLFSGIWDVANIREIGGVVDEETADAFIDINEFVKETLIPHMIHSNYKKRWNIDTCIHEFTKVIQRKPSSTNGGRSITIRKQTRKKVHSKKRQTKQKEVR